MRAATSISIQKRPICSTCTRNDGSINRHDAKRAAVGNRCALENEQRNHVQLRPALAEDFLQIANVHCESFYGSAGIFWDTLLRLDRLLCLREVERQKTWSEREQVCIVALQQCSERDFDNQGNIILKNVHEWIRNDLETRKRFRAEGTEDRIGLSEEYEPETEDHEPETDARNPAQVIGAVVVDTHMAFIPPRVASWSSSFSQKGNRLPPRKLMAYVSNLAVRVSHRQNGNGAALMHAAEEHAKSWNCTSIALHVDPSNSAAYSLYRNLGYRPVSQQPKWQSMIEGRSLLLMVKRVCSP